MKLEGAYNPGEVEKGSILNGWKKTFSEQK